MASGPLARWLRGLLAACVVADLILVAGLWVPFVAEWRLGPLRLLTTDIDVLVLVALGAATLRLATWPARRAAAEGLLAEAVARLRAAGWARRLGMLASLALVSAHLVGYLDGPFEGMRLKLERAAAATTGINDRASSRHVARLASFAAQRASSEPLVVYVDDDDRRAYQAAFYCYPMLLLMEPGLRTWATRDRQLRYERFDPLWGDPTFAAPGTVPGVEASRTFAAERGLDFAVASGRTAQLVARGAAGARPPKRVGAEP